MQQNRSGILCEVGSCMMNVVEHIDKYVPASNFVPADSFVVSVEMRMSGIKVIEQKRAYDFQSLIGNCGGYIGLLLGNYFINIHLYK